LLATPTPLDAHENDAWGVPVRDVDTVQAQALVLVDHEVAARVHEPSLPPGSRVTTMRPVCTGAACTSSALSLRPSWWSMTTWTSTLVPSFRRLPQAVVHQQPAPPVAVRHECQLSASQLCLGLPAARCHQVIQRAGDSSTSDLENMRIDHRGAHVAMAEQLLNGSNVRSSL
jgi:hypothetical protein